MLAVPARGATDSGELRQNCWSCSCACTLHCGRWPKIGPRVRAAEQPGSQEAGQAAQQTSPTSGCSPHCPAIACRVPPTSGAACRRHRRRLSQAKLIHSGETEEEERGQVEIVADAEADQMGLAGTTMDVKSW